MDSLSKLEQRVRIVADLLEDWDFEHPQRVKIIFKHFAQIKKYDVFGFVEKGDKDNLFSSIKNMSNLKNSEIQLIFKDYNLKINKKEIKDGQAEVIDSKIDQKNNSKDPHHFELNLLDPNYIHYCVMLFFVVHRDFNGAFVAINKRSANDIGIEQLFKGSDKKEFCKICIGIRNCVMSAVSIIKKDTRLWNKYLETNETTQKEYLTAFIKGALNREIIKLDAGEINKIILIMDAFIYIVKNMVSNKKVDTDGFNKIKDVFGKIIMLFNAHVVKYYHLKNIIITSNFLIAYFLIRMIKELSSGSDRLSILSESEKLTLYQRVARAIKFYFIRSEEEERKHLLFANPSREDSQEEETDHFVDMAHLVSEYASLFAEVPRDLNIEKHLNDAATSQVIFYATKKNFRDHFPHVLDVCFFGLFLLDKLFYKYKPIWQPVNIRNWLVASLFHDMGYVMEIYELANKETGYLKSGAIGEIREAITRELESHSRAYNDYAMKKFSDMGLELPPFPQFSLNHSVIGAVYLMELLDKIPTRDDHEKKELLRGYREAVRAVALHNLPGAKIPLATEPISFLLYFCDELQDWERPRVEALAFRQRVLAAVKFGSGVLPRGNTMLQGIGLEASGNPMMGKLVVPSRGGDPLPILPFTLDYTAVKDEEFYIIYSWLIKSFKFQFLLMPDQLDIRVRFVSKPRAQEGDWNRLKTARRKKQIWQFEKWFKLASTKYKFEDGKEELELSLKELQQQQPLQENPVKYLEELIQEWKNI